MKNKIQAIYPQSVFHESHAPKLYIADFTERTESARKVEFHENIPFAPNSNDEMDCLTIENPSRLPMVCNIFNDNQFKDENGNDIQHCECVLFPESNQEEKIAVAFVEIKDCKPKNISVYKQKAKEQVISTVQIFRGNGILNKQSIYGIISIPRKNKVSFNQTIFDDPSEYKKLYHQYKIHFFPTNCICIINGKTITAKLGKDKL